MIELNATIKNSAGIHCRPSALIIKAAASYSGTIQVESPGHGTCTLRSVLDLISMGLEQGAQIVIRVEGEGEEAFCRKLADLFETEFDFPPA
ncbi:MAG: HPr family phosphocarrier protein [Kiritimatiellae bacterium]|nr:HPr family phosphocarrier protein [Kiritimatiellia bacterium]MDD4734666.1 HPr family phosphocarrier protein [Kiritimatiellia bacterium]